MLKRYDEAEPALLEAHTTISDPFGPDDTLVRTTAQWLSQLYIETDRPDEAAKWSAAATTLPQG